MQSDAIRCNQTPSEAIRGHQTPSDAISALGPATFTHRSSDAIRRNQTPSAHLDQPHPFIVPVEEPAHRRAEREATAYQHDD